MVARHRPFGSRRTTARAVEGNAPDGIEVHPISCALGAEVRGVDLSQPLDDSTFAVVHRAFLDHLVIFLPGQRLTPAQHTAFAARFGEVDRAPFVFPFKPPAVSGHPEILNVVKEANDTAVNFGGLWHADVTHRERPHLGSMIYALEAPAHGGDTMFANQYLAHDTLSPGMRRMLAGLRTVHNNAMSYGGESARFGAVSRTQVPHPEDRSYEASVHEIAERPPLEENEHPVVRTHPDTGRKCLFVNLGFTTRFVDMTEEESRSLLEFLWNHAVRPEFTCRYRWANGTLGIWDNRCTQHYALNDYYGQRRHMHRIAIHGDRPV